MRASNLEIVQCHSQARLARVLNLDGFNKFRNLDFIGKVFACGAHLNRMEGFLTFEWVYLASGMNSTGWKLEYILKVST